MKVYYFFAAFIVWQGIVSLRGGIRYLNFFRDSVSNPLPPFTPYLSLIAPCRGLDQGLVENLEALFRQTYPGYQILFVVDDEQDPAVSVIRRLCKAHAETTTITAKLIIAGKSSESGQKVHNLLTAIDRADARSEVFVFVDSDARPPQDWLVNLVAPLANPEIGAATGYRWFIPIKGNAASLLRSVWNASIASALGPDLKRNFCWGGSTAIRRETFDLLGMRDKWRGTLSDDFGLTRALQQAKLPIYFVPQCLIASHEDCTFAELLEFTTRQMKITRVYAPHLWQIVLWTGSIFIGVFFGGLILIFTGLKNGLYFWPLLFTLAIFLLGAAKAYYRLRAVSIPLSQYRREIMTSTPAHLLWWPLASALYVYNASAALFSRRITWRGITYELKSPAKTVIIEKQ